MQTPQLSVGVLTKSKQNLTHCTFVHVLSAVCSLMALRTGADIVSVHRIGIAQSAFLAWIADTRIIQVAQETYRSSREYSKQRDVTVKSVHCSIESSISNRDSHIQKLEQYLTGFNSQTTTKILPRT